MKKLLTPFQQTTPGPRPAGPELLGVATSHRPSREQETMLTVRRSRSPQHQIGRSNRGCAWIPESALRRSRRRTSPCGRQPRRSSRTRICLFAGAAREANAGRICASRCSIVVSATTRRGWPTMVPQLKWMSRKIDSIGRQSVEATTFGAHTGRRCYSHSYPLSDARSTRIRLPGGSARRAQPAKNFVEVCFALGGRDATEG